MATGRVTWPWRHNGRDDVSNHQPRDYLLNRSRRRRSKKTSKLRVTSLCGENSPMTGEFSHKWPVTRKMFPFDDVIMKKISWKKLIAFWLSFRISSKDCCFIIGSWSSFLTENTVFRISISSNFISLRSVVSNFALVPLIFKPMTSKIAATSLRNCVVGRQCDTQSRISMA